MVYTVCLCACTLGIYKLYVLRLEAIPDEQNVLGFLLLQENTMSKEQVGEESFIKLTLQH